MVAHLLEFSHDQFQALLETHSNANSNISARQIHGKDTDEVSDKKADFAHDPSSNESDKDRQYFTLLKQIMHNIPNASTDTMLWTVGVRLGTSIVKQVSFEGSWYAI